MKKGPRRRLKSEYKAETVRLMLENDMMLAQAARDMDLTDSSLRNWVEQARADEGSGPARAATSAELEELRRLRREMLTSGFYTWLRRKPSARELRDRRLRTEVAAIHKASHKTYGSPRVHADFKARKVAVSRKRVARLMREAGLVGVTPRPYRCTTDSDHEHPVADNVLDRQFEIETPNKVWAADVNYIRTWEGWLYLAVILDLFSRRVVGWAIADHLRAELVTPALDMALGRRQPGDGLLHHSDRGSQYAGKDYRKELKNRKITCSMSRRGDCWDNAVAECFFGPLKTELIYRRPWLSHRAAATAIAEDVEVFYNRHRRHSYLGDLSPADFEGAQEQAALAA